MKLIITAFLLVEGTGLIVFAQILRKRALQRIQTFRRLQGQVIDVLEKRANKGGIVKKPVVRYQNWNGEMVTFTNNFGSSNWKIQVGDIVDILVNPEDPQDAEVVYTMGQFGLSRILTFAGLMSWGFAGVAFFAWEKLNL